MYDSTEDTQKHIALVGGFLTQFAHELAARAFIHDKSKLEDPEKSIFDEFTPKLKATTYGSQKYKDFLGGMDAALLHHYAANRHHPEHFKDGMFGMNLADLVEMFCDWMAAVERHDDGDIMQSIGINGRRFGYGVQLAAIFNNTARMFQEDEENAE